jgi:hypothetical protein
METFRLMSKHDMYDAELIVDFSNSFLVATKISKNAYMGNQTVYAELSLSDFKALRDYLNSVLECGHEKEIG